MMPIKNTRIKASQLRNLKEARDRLAKRERYQGASNAPQWLFWATHTKYLRKFDALLRVLEVAEDRKLTRSETGLIKDALAIGVTNVTPDRVEWTFRYAPKQIRYTAANLFDPERVIDSVELATLAATPFDPSSDEYYSQLWTGFKGSLVRKSDAYNWY